MLAACLALAACSVQRTGQGPNTRVLLEDGRTEWRWVGESRPDLAVRAKSADGVRTEVAVLTGIRVVQEVRGERRELELPFQGSEGGGSKVRVDVVQTPEHRIHLELSLVGPGRVRVEVVDRIDLPVVLRELSLTYRWAAPADPQEATARGDAASGLWSDSQLALPLGWLRGGRTALALEPDVELLRRDRRVPAFLATALGPESGLRQGLAVPAAEREGTARGIALRGETIRFAHTVETLDDALPRTSLHLQATGLWARQVGSRLQGPPITLSQTPLDQLVARGLAELAQTQPRIGEEIELMGLEAPIPRAAAAALLHATRTGEAPWRERALQWLDEGLAAPARGGLVASTAVQDAKGRRTWLRSASRWGLDQAYRAADSAAALHWLLIAELHGSERRSEIRDLCATAARFWTQNQLPSGQVPALYEATWLAPLRDPDRSEGAEAAVVALFLARHARVTGDQGSAQAATRLLEWLERESAAGRGWRLLAGTAPLQRGSGDQALPLAAAALAATLLHEFAPGAATARRCTTLLGDLALLQWTWSPIWNEPNPDVDLHVGALAAEYGSARIDLAATGLAAEAFARGYLALDRPEWLARGVLAMRTGLANASLASGASPETASAALAAAGILRDLLGDIVLDAGRRSSLGVDSLWVEFRPTAEDGSEVQVLSRLPWERKARLRIRGDPAGASPRLNIAGSEAAGQKGGAPEAGIEVAPRLAPGLRFRAPTRVAEGSRWTPQVEALAPLATGDQVEVEIRQRGQILDRIRLRSRDRPEILSAERAFDATGVPVGVELEARAVLIQAGREEWFPARDARRVVVDGMAALDPGEDGEERLAAAEGSRIVRFADGRENARAAAPGGGFEYLVPIESSTTSVRLVARVSGALEILAGGVSVHADTRAEEPVVRDLELTVVDRRLWESGILRLRFAAVSPRAAFAVAHVRYAAEGHAPLLPGSLGASRRLREPDARLRLLVLRAEGGVPDEASARQALEQAFFGGPEYRSTPPPVPRRSAGSLASLALGASAGRTVVEGGVRALPGAAAAPAPADSAAAADLARAWIRAALAALPDTKRPPDVVFVVHGWRAVPAPLDGGIATAAALGALDPEQPGARIPFVFLPEREPDGSLVACGRILASLLQARYGNRLEATPEDGNFGDLALATCSDLHLPPLPLGLHLAAAGWADLLPLQARDRTLVELAPLRQGRVLYRLPGSFLRDRGDLHLEMRNVAGEGTETAGGMLAYWSLPPGIAIQRPDGAPTELRFLRLSPERPLLRTPYTPGDETQLFRNSTVLADRDRPSLATPQGERLWTIRSFRPDAAGGAMVDLEPAFVDLLADGQPGLRPDAAGAALEIPLPGRPVPRRVFATLRAAGIAGAKHLLVRAGHAELRVALQGGADATALCVDLPPARTLALVLEGAEPAGVAAPFQQLVVTARESDATAVLVPASAQGGAELLQDGVVYAQVVRLAPLRPATPGVEAPVVLPAGSSLLRITFGLPAGTAPGLAGTLTLAWRGIDESAWTRLGPAVPVRRGEGRTPLRTLLVELPAGPVRRAGILRLVWESAEGEPLRVTALEVTRS